MPDRHAPWFDAIRPWIARVGWPDGSAAWLAAVNACAREQGLACGSGRPLRFVDARAVDTHAYEAHIAATGEVPTRLADDGRWHDGLNAFAWLAFPRTKARLNALQAQAIARDGVRAVRGPLRDAITLFDESGAIWVEAGDGLAGAGAPPAGTGAPVPLGALLRGQHWQALFVDQRARVSREVRVWVLGHALLDKLRAPYKSVCARTWIVRAPPADGCAAIDAVVAASLDADALAPRALAPLPVLGLPGWWPANGEAAFYNDPSVFRPARPGDSPRTPRRQRS